MRAVTLERIPAEDMFARLLECCIIGSMTPLIKRDCFAMVGGFNEDRRLLCFEDWELWTRLATRFHWHLVPEVLGYYRLHQGNTQHAATPLVDEVRMDCLLNYELNRHKNLVARRYIAARCWHWATALYNSAPNRALSLLFRMVRAQCAVMLQKNFWGLLGRALRAKVVGDGP